MSNKIIVNSCEPPSLYLELPEVSKMEFCNVDYMCIKKPGGLVLVPENFSRYINKDMVLMTTAIRLLNELRTDEALKHNLNIHDCYWYLSIKRGYVNPGQCQTLNEWHIDGFQRDDYNLIWSDNLPTLYSEGKYELTPDRYDSLNEYKEQVADTLVEPTKTHRLYYLNQECVHAPAIHSGDKPIVRTFIKLTMTKRLFDSIGNAWNYLIPDIIASGERSNFPKKADAIAFNVTENLR